MPKSAYIHTPFCKSKCKYCSFISFNKLEFIKGYIYSLLKEITETYAGEPLKTLYFGGGTPSLIPVDLIKMVLKKFNLSEECEVTLEVNPDDATYEYFCALKNTGVNRISLGVQTFDDDILKFIGRRHTSRQVSQAVQDAKKAGFENISVDLIYGLPKQNIIGLRCDLDKFLSLGIQHISTYGLKIEPDSFWGKNPPSVPDDDIQADMYELINDMLSTNDFYRYEISNFARKGFESKHNLNYWNNDEYYGFGVSAHGYADGMRYSNFRKLEQYMANPAIHETGHFLTKKEMLEEEIFLGFRKSEGINVNRIKERYGVDFDERYKDILEKYKDFVEKTSHGYALNLKGVLLSNLILADFID